MNATESTFKKKINFILIFISCYFLYPINIIGAQVTWTLNGVTFDDGGTASGYFVSDTELPNGVIPIVDWEIKTNGGDEVVFPKFTYNSDNSFSAYSGPYLDDSRFRTVVFWEAPANISSRMIQLIPSEDLSPAGGSIPLQLNNQYEEDVNVECYSCYPYRLITRGSIIGKKLSTDKPKAFPGVHLLLENNNAWIKGIWKVVSKREECADEKSFTSSPFVFDGIVYDYYYKILENTFQEYMHISSFPTHYSYKPGIYYCSNWMISHTSSINTNSTLYYDGTTIIFDTNENKLIVQMKYDHDPGCIDTYICTKVDESNVAEAINSCVIMDDIWD